MMEECKSNSINNEDKSNQPQSRGWSYLLISLSMNVLLVTIFLYSYINSMSTNKSYPNALTVISFPKLLAIQTDNTNSRSRLRRLDETPPAPPTREVYKYWHLNHARAPRKIVIDLGANKGDSVNHFLDKSGKKNVDFNDGAETLKGCCGDGTWEIVVFEGNPLFNDDLNKLKEHYESNKIVQKFHLFSGTAISTTSGTVTFVKDNNEDSYSSTIFKDTKNYVGQDGMGASRVTVPSVGIEDLFARLEILPKDFVILKVDIEGYEYELIRRFYAEGLQALVDTLAVEWHINGLVDNMKEKYTCYQEALIWLGSDVSGMNQIVWQ